MRWDHRVGRRLKLRDLNILFAVVEAGSMAKAATRLAISQPAISRAIADLEHTLRVPLFDRSARGVEPTQYGQALLRRGLAAFDELAQGVKDIEFLADPSGGELRVGSTPGLADGIGAAVIERLSQRYPRISVHLLPSGAHAQFEDLRSRRIELGFAGTAAPISQPDIAAEVLFEEPLVVVAGVESPWTCRRKIELAELINEPWTWPSAGSLIDSLVVEAFRANGVEPPRATLYADPYTMRIRLAATGRFLAIVPSSIMRFPGKPSAIKALPIELPTTRRQIGIITLRNRALSPLAHIFIECAREIAKRLAKSV